MCIIGWMDQAPEIYIEVKVFFALFLHGPINKAHLICYMLDMFGARGRAGK